MIDVKPTDVTKLNKKQQEVNKLLSQAKKASLEAEQAKLELDELCGEILVENDSIGCQITEDFRFILSAEEVAQMHVRAAAELQQQKQRINGEARG